MGRLKEDFSNLKKNYNTLLINYDVVSQDNYKQRIIIENMKKTFKEIIEVCERNNYSNETVKIRKIKEVAKRFQT